MEDFNSNGNISDSQKKRERESVFDHNAIALILFLFLLVAFSLAGCANDTSDNPKPPLAAPPTPIASADNGLVAQNIAGTNPNEYAVHLNWDGLSTKMPTVVYRKDKSGTLQPLATVNSGVSTFDDRSVTPGETYTYLLAVSSDGDPTFRANATITVLKDAVVTGRQAATDIKGFSRLFFVKGSALETLGTAVTIEVNEIISPDGMIQTFAQDAKAPAGQAGRAGGSIEIRAKHGSGSLHIFARGESGGDGLDGVPGNAGANGIQGQPGDWGINTDLYKYLNRSFVDSYGMLMRRFPKPPENPEWVTVFAGRPLYICARPPTNGTPGIDGGAAKDGGSGGNGGDSATVNVHIADPSDIAIDVSSEPGLSGIGGRAGKGGSPGVGGPPGPQDQGHRCGPASVGPNGQTGIDGRQGRPGTSGMKQPVCVRIGNQTNYDCEKFKE